MDKTIICKINFNVIMNVKKINKQKIRRTLKTLFGRSECSRVPKVNKDFSQKPYSVTIKETYKLHEYFTNVNQLYAYIYNGIGKTDNIILSILTTYEWATKEGRYNMYTITTAHKRGNPYGRVGASFLKTSELNLFRSALYTRAILIL